MTRTGEVYQVKRIVRGIVHARKLKFATDGHGKAPFFSSPLPSTELGISISCGFENENISLPESAFQDSKKSIVLSYESNQGSNLFLIMPLLHHKLK
jgi:hypothetical protein